METKTYRGHEITFSASVMRFSVRINGDWKEFSSYQSACNAIDKSAVIDFKPIEVLKIESKGYSPSTYYLEKVKLVEYYEQKKWRGYLERGFKTERDKKGDYDTISVKADIFPVSAQEKLENIIRELNELELEQDRIEKRQEKLSQQQNKLVIILDPRPELNR